MAQAALAVPGAGVRLGPYGGPVAEPILTWHPTGHTSGPIEGLNSLIKKVKRSATGFRSFPNYRLRILLACGGCNWDLLGTPPR